MEFLNVHRRRLNHAVYGQNFPCTIEVDDNLVVVAGGRPDEALVYELGKWSLQAFDIALTIHHYDMSWDELVCTTMTHNVMALGAHMRVLRVAMKHG